MNDKKLQDALHTAQSTMDKKAHKTLKTLQDTLLRYVEAADAAFRAAVAQQTAQDQQRIKEQEKLVLQKDALVVWKRHCAEVGDGSLCDMFIMPDGRIAELSENYILLKSPKSLPDSSKLYTEEQLRERKGEP